MSENLDETAKSAPAPARVRFTLASRKFWLVIGLLALFAATAQFIGPAKIPVGAASITLLPMMWGLLLGGVLSGQRIRPLGTDLQHAVGAVLSLLLLVLVARFSFTIGPNIGLLLQAGPALLLQEVGHLFGTIVLALPLAVLLRMGPATIGATFSIDREPAFSMVSTRYGSNSPQYQGVLSMYIFGSVFGAALVSVIASLTASLGVFDPLALAMGSGMGSSSMMAAGAASVASVHPELNDQILAVAATANVLTGVLGVYVGIFIGLPLAERAYRLLTRRTRQEAPPQRSLAVKAGAHIVVTLHTTLPVSFGVGVLVAAIAEGGLSWSIIGGYLVITALVGISLAVCRLARGKFTPLLVILTLGAAVSSPVSPIAGVLADLVNSVELLSITTAVLTAAGLSLGKDLPALRSISWRIVPVGIVAIAASYLLSVVIAEFALGLWG
ncbi:DUF3100 domain-containing protein [Saccharopolyspora sp. WRP15-2]|uniref:DUF3100 domain-containing protein n=1 Tax=Saccharopolyspora oryzae TaxID=2997343 RepID=A0ABT4VBG9_9PSEU|nr:DUF3100 domain-containing protein [Saccharopolyspora oryzae]MDA3630736.1 DUF3100 domain-containing protein [Saccharopolyspora oryzae]